MSNSNYDLITCRNLGLISESEQDKIRNAKVAICGLGGIGSPIAEMLARLGIGSFSILDHGIFEPTNMNRQIFMYAETDGKWKTDVTEDFLKRINPDIRIKKYTQMHLGNVEEFLYGSNVAILAADSILPILLMSRKARELSIPLVEGWAVAFGNVRVFTDDTPSLEEVYKFPSIGRDIEDISEQEQEDMLLKSIFDMADSFPGLIDHYPEEALQRMKEEKIGTTLSPLVWLSSVMMAIEVVKIILGKGELALAPSFAVYDPFDFRAFRSMNG
jgi:molybdopterin/thiamine biosynthesis adenylyltransferase